MNRGILPKTGCVIAVAVAFWTVGAWVNQSHGGPGLTAQGLCSSGGDCTQVQIYGIHGSGRDVSNDCTQFSYCIFTSTDTPVLYCDGSPTDTCVIPTPLSTVSCTGYCANSPAYGCTTKYSACDEDP